TEIIECDYAIGDEEGEKQNHAAEEGGAVVAEDEVDDAGDEIGPADEAEDSVPFGADGDEGPGGVESDDALALAAAIGEGEENHGGPAEDAEDDGEGARPNGAEGKNCGEIEEGCPGGS